MAIEIAVIGLRQKGLSAALALSDKDERIQLIGWDPDKGMATAAKTENVFKKIAANLETAIRNTQLIILSLPVVELEECKADFGKNISEDTVIVNITDLQEFSAIWLRDGFKQTVQYISIFPALNSEIVLADDYENGRPNKDLFRGGVIYILDPLNAGENALDLAVLLSVILGGKPILADPVEVDGMVCANEFLPQLCAAALMSVAADQPSWREGQLIAGNAMANATLPLEEINDEGLSIYHQRSHIVRLADAYIESMMAFRNYLLSDNLVAFNEKMESARVKRQGWINERLRPLPASELFSSFPDENQALKQFLKLDRV
jgi:prephenate dehydrogenase